MDSANKTVRHARLKLNVALSLQLIGKVSACGAAERTFIPPATELLWPKLVTVLTVSGVHQLEKDSFFYGAGHESKWHLADPLYAYDNVIYILIKQLNDNQTVWLI